MRLLSSAFVLLAPAVSASAIPSPEPLDRATTKDVATNLTPRGLSKVLNIALQRSDDNYSWQFYATPKGMNANCNVVREQKDDPNKTVDEVWASLVDAGDDPNDESGVLSMWPGGTFPSDHTFNIGDKKCQYMNNGGNTGRMWCEGKEIVCKYEQAALGNPGRKKTDGPWFECIGRGEETLSGSPVYQLPFITCDEEA
jgi:hypothetical protein